MQHVDERIFQLAGNEYYSYEFLVFWVVAMSSNSLSEQVVAAFNKNYIWVHFYSRGAKGQVSVSMSENCRDRHIINKKQGQPTIILDCCPKVDGYDRILASC